MKYLTDANGHEDGTTAQTDPDILQSAGRILDVLLCFTKNHADWSIAELAEELGFHKSVTRRLVITLASRGFLRQDPFDKRYKLGLVLFELGSAIFPTEELVDLSRPFMKKLSKETDSSVFLTINADNQAVCVARVDSPNPLRVTFEVGRRSPLHAGASARAILAFLPDSRIRSILEEGLESFTDATITDVESLTKELNKTKELGYTISTGELDDRVTAIGVPIMDRNDQVLASLSISGPTTDFSPDRLLSLIQSTRACATTIQNVLRNQ
jgi:DNA-binding IclR family transcriptional regulator